MSEYGERLSFNIDGEVICIVSGDRYRLENE